MITVIFNTPAENTIQVSDLVYNDDYYYGAVALDGTKCILTQRSYWESNYFTLLVAKNLTCQSYIKTSNHNETFTGMMKFLEEYHYKLFVFNNREEFFEWLKKDAY